eukprot:scaffold77249_cov32-Tisochrysis_lutea.AAC.1
MYAASCGLTEPHVNKLPNSARRTCGRAMRTIVGVMCVVFRVRVESVACFVSLLAIAALCSADRASHLTTLQVAPQT